jgi:hypothetical protein
MRSGIAATVLAIPFGREEKFWPGIGASGTRQRRAPRLRTGVITTGLAGGTRRLLRRSNTLLLVPHQ